MASSAKKHKRENTCNFCLYFQPEPTGQKPSQGNCTYHKEWIEKANLTTCSDMCEANLQNKGIFSLVPVAKGDWIYVRRSRRIRTKLFVVGGRGGSRKDRG